MDTNATVENTSPSTETTKDVLSLPKKEKVKKAAAPKKEATKKEAPKKQEAKTVSKKEVAPPTTSRGSFPLDAKITLLTKENPHRKDSNLHKIFAKYKNGMTVQQALDAGVPWINLRYLKGLEHIKIG